MNQEIVTVRTRGCEDLGALLQQELERRDSVRIVSIATYENRGEYRLVAVTERLDHSRSGS